MRKPSVTDPHATLLVFFQLGDQAWAIELKWVREVFPAHGVEPLPNASPIAAGMLNIRGEIVPVINGAGLLSAIPESETPRRAGKVLLIHHQGEDLGMVVDLVLQVGAMEIENFTPLNSGREYPWQTMFVKQVVRKGGDQLIPLLDVPFLVEHVTGYREAHDQTYLREDLA